MIIIALMLLRNYIYIMTITACFASGSVSLSALCNNIYLVADQNDPRIAQTWLSECLPKIPEPQKRTEAIVNTAPEAPVDVTGDVKFAPQPGASFQYDENEFSKYREAFRSDY